MVVDALPARKKMTEIRRDELMDCRPEKTKFHYAIWFEAGSKLVADSADGFEPASNQIA